MNISLLLVVILVTNYYFHFVDDESHCLVMRETCMAVGAGMEDSTELVVCVCVCVMCIMAGGAGMEDSMELVHEDHRQLLSKHISRVHGIREILSRDRMKVVFFGR